MTDHTQEAPEKFRLFFGSESWPGEGFVMPTGQPHLMSVIVPVEDATGDLPTVPAPDGSGGRYVAFMTDASILEPIQRFFSASNEGRAPSPSHERSTSRYGVTERGFKNFPVIETDYGHVLRVYESSAALEPHVWLAVEGTDTTNGDSGELHVHLTVEQAERVRDTLDAAVRNHYQFSGEHGPGTEGEGE